MVNSAIEIRHGKFRKQRGESFEHLINQAREHHIHRATLGCDAVEDPSPAPRAQIDLLVREANLKPCHTDIETRQVKQSMQADKSNLH